MMYNIGTINSLVLSNYTYLRAVDQRRFLQHYDFRAECVMHFLIRGFTSYDTPVLDTPQGLLRLLEHRKRFFSKRVRTCSKTLFLVRFCPIQTYLFNREIRRVQHESATARPEQARFAMSNWNRTKVSLRFPPSGNVDAACMCVVLTSSSQSSRLVDSPGLHATRELQNEDTKT